MSLNNNSLIAKALKRARLTLNRHGYDVHPIDGRCLDDQRALLSNREDPLIFDVGANVGQTAAEFRVFFPRSQIFCFEPQADLCKEIESHFKDDPKTFVYCCAVGSTEGLANFYLNAKRDTSSLLPSDSPHLSSSYGAILKTEDSCSVRVITLDSFAFANDLTHIDVLKLDIQGGELDALLGAKRLLSEAKVDIVYSEVYFVPMYSDQPLFGDLVSQLAQWDYKLHLIYNQTVNGITGRPLWGDALFVSPQMREASRERLRSSWIK